MDLGDTNAALTREFGTPSPDGSDVEGSDPDAACTTFKGGVTRGGGKDVLKEWVGSNDDVAEGSGGGRDERSDEKEVSGV